MRRDRTRRVASGAVVVLAVAGILSALAPPLRGRLDPLLDVLPLGVPLGAQTVLIPVSVALLLLARGLRLGVRQAWAVATGLLLVSVALHVLKGIDLPEAVLDLLLAGWLSVQVGAFPVRVNRAHARRSLLMLAGGAVVTVAVCSGLVVLVGTWRHPRETVVAVVQRLIGVREEPLDRLRGGHGGALTPMVTPALLALGLCLIVLLLWAVFAPRSAPELTVPQQGAARERARAIVTEHGGDTLDYFALRDDKDYFFGEESTGGLVAYSVRRGVCLVSPDPIGPPARRGALLAEFLAFVEEHGWAVAVVGAREEWLPLYEAARLRPVYLGDEAILDCPGFSLQGSRMKGLRGAVNRVRKAGVEVTFHDPATMTPEESADVLAMAGESRQGPAERGYSMTLSRLFDPADTGLLLSVARFADGRPAGFIQWVPAAGIDGYSLDVMRRSTEDGVPNGLTDFLIVATAEHLAGRGMRGLGLNFAVLREIVAGERAGRIAEVGRRVLHTLSRRSQIESLWKFNAKYDPQWRARYVILDALDSAAAQSLAIAEAEGITELPGIGRVLRRPTAS
ncbi:hypothetical protein GCM10010435_22880 [Winogradskya consettensis]|uniref:DUF2156 domain-containing protein n=2 Tax=Winogradskya consettensis TaxID=113560 RepID=A0A919W6G5_9ACTN|nr:hypothetical protein Aco04nite_86190 [Actinoplanes consettensis]